MIAAIHVYVISTPGETTTDSEGRTVTTSSASVTVQGSVDQVSSEEFRLAAAIGQRHDIVCRQPIEDAEPAAKALVIVTEPEELTGTYRLETVRTLRTHRRLLCSKTGVT